MPSRPFGLSTTQCANTRGSPGKKMTPWDLSPICLTSTCRAVAKETVRLPSLYWGWPRPAKDCGRGRRWLARIYKRSPLRWPKLLQVDPVYEFMGLVSQLLAKHSVQVQCGRVDTKALFCSPWTPSWPQRAESLLGGRCSLPLPSR